MKISRKQARLTIVLLLVIALVGGFIVSRVSQTNHAAQAVLSSPTPTITMPTEVTIVYDVSSIPPWLRSYVPTHDSAKTEVDRRTGEFLISLPQVEHSQRLPQLFAMPTNGSLTSTAAGKQLPGCEFFAFDLDASGTTMKFGCDYKQSITSPVALNAELKMVFCWFDSVSGETFCSYDSGGSRLDLNVSANRKCVFYTAVGAFIPKYKLLVEEVTRYLDISYPWPEVVHPNSLYSTCGQSSE